MAADRRVLIIACGALAREVAAVRQANGWSHVEVRCLPPELHNRPERIPAAVRQAIRENRAQYRAIFVAYADCGTGGLLDTVLHEESVERLPGAHCYEFFAGADAFAALCAAEPGTFYLTDFLLRHFERLVVRGLGLDEHPELASEYFRHYHRLVYLAQTHSEAARKQASQIAARFGFAFEYRFTGLGGLQAPLEKFVAMESSWPS